MSDLNKQLDEIKQRSIAALKQFDAEVSDEEQRDLMADSVSALVVNSDLLILRASPELEALFGYYTTALQGVPLSTLIPEALRGKHEQHTASYLESPRSRAMGDFKGPLRALKANGEEFTVNVSLKPRKVRGTLYVIAQVVNLPE